VGFSRLQRSRAANCETSRFRRHELTYTGTKNTRPDAKKNEQLEDG
jgi:hypothetical protein